jgi:hypothetical protein
LRVDCAKFIWRAYCAAANRMRQTTTTIHIARAPQKSCALVVSVWEYVVPICEHEYVPLYEYA